jgi:hypothetical protein
MPLQTKAQQASKRVVTVRQEKGLWSDVPSLRTINVDHTDEAVFQYFPDAPPVQVLAYTVPAGQAMMIDNFYFYARLPYPYLELIPAGLIERYIAFEMTIEGTDNIERSFLAATAAQSKGFFPFVNDRFGPREVTYGTWIFEGQTVRATYSIFPGALPPPVPILYVGFRLQGVKTERIVAEEMLRSQK